MTKSNPYIIALVWLASCILVLGAIICLIGYGQTQSWDSAQRDAGAALVAFGGALFGLGVFVGVGWLVAGAVTWRAPVESNEPVASDLSD